MRWFVKPLRHLDWRQLQFLRTQYAQSLREGMPGLASIGCSSEGNVRSREWSSLVQPQQILGSDDAVGETSCMIKLQCNFPAVHERV